MTSREAFEAEFRLIGWPCGKSSMCKTEYASPTVEDHWQTWQTAWQASRKQALEEMAKLIYEEVQYDHGFNFADKYSEQIRNLK